MYNIYLYIYLFILICTREKVEPWSFFSNSPEKASPPRSNTKWWVNEKPSEPNPASVPTRQRDHDDWRWIHFDAERGFVLNTCVRNEWGGARRRSLSGARIPNHSGPSTSENASDVWARRRKDNQSDCFPVALSFPDVSPIPPQASARSRPVGTQNREDERHGWRAVHRVSRQQKASGGGGRAESWRLLKVRAGMFWEVF